ncbi:MAG: ABC transporter permease [Spirochaetota bacterium]
MSSRDAAGRAGSEAGDEGRRRVWKAIPARKVVLGLAGLAGFVAVWELAVRSGVFAATLVPRPSDIPATLVAEIERGVWQQMVLASLSHYALGLGIGTGLGVALGTAVALSPGLHDAQAYLVRVLRPIPPLAWIPFAIIWFGISETSAAFIISIGVFWINYFATSGAIRAVDRDLVEVARVFGHGGFQARLRKVLLPAALPGMLVGVRTGLGQGWMTVVAAELFGIQGIGQRMMEASGLLAIDVVAVYMVTIALLYGLTDIVFISVERVVLRWTEL